MSHFFKLVIGLSAGLLILAIYIAAMYLFQNQLLYHPTKVHPEHYVPAGMQRWPTQPQARSNTPNDILGLVAEPDTEQPVKGTVIVFHGNAGHAGDRHYYAQQLRKLGMRVILAEYPGYGPRPGKPSETIIIDDATRIVTLAHQQYEQPIWLIGESLGAGVAAVVAGRVPSLTQGIVLITPWNSLYDVASHHYPLLPVRQILRSEYDSIEALRLYNGPKLVIVADGDTVVPTEFGLDLYQNLPDPKRLLIIEGAGHSDWTAHASPTLWSDAMQWLAKEQSSQ